MSSPSASPFDAVVLAGGRASRLGGVSKPDVVIAGRRLIDLTLDAAAGARAVVVVGPPEVAPPGVLVTIEDPPGGGPVAGLAAGLAALADEPADLVLVLGCDVPRAVGAVDGLFAALLEDADRGSGDDPVADGAAAEDPDGRLQVLLALYRRRALDAAVARLEAGEGVRDASMRRLVDGLRLVRVPDPEGRASDVDTWADVRAAEVELGGRAP